MGLCRSLYLLLADRAEFSLPRSPPVPTYLISITPQAAGLERREQGQVIAVSAADPASALRKAERTLRGEARSAELQCLGIVQRPPGMDRRVSKRRAADCH